MSFSTVCSSNAFCAISIAAVCRLSDMSTALICPQPNTRLSQRVTYAIKTDDTHDWLGRLAFNLFDSHFDAAACPCLFGMGEEDPERSSLLEPRLQETMREKNAAKKQHGSGTSLTQ